MPDTLDVIDITEARDAVNITTANHNEALELMVTAISRRMDELVGPIVNRTYTEYHDGGEHYIVPHRTPVSSIGTLTEADGTSTTVLTEETFGTTPSDGYVLAQNEHYPHDCEVIRREQGFDANFPTGRRNVKLEYTAGRAASTTAVDERYKQVAKEILTRNWERESGAWNRPVDPFDPNTQGSTRFFNSIDFVVKEKLRDEMKPPGVG